MGTCPCHPKAIELDSRFADAWEAIGHYHGAAETRGCPEVIAMPDDGGEFDEAFLAEVDRAIDFACDAWMSTAGKSADEYRAARNRALYTSIDLFRWQRRMFVWRPAVPASRKYRIVADGILHIMGAWGRVPPQFTKFYVPQEVYEKLYPLYLTARDRASGLA